MIRERVRSAPSGWLALAILLALLFLSGYSSIRAFMRLDMWAALAWMAAEVVVVVCLCGLFVVNPNEGRVLQLFGAYVGTVREAGLRWASPFYSKRRLSLRVRNFESGRLKVNDTDGNPVEIAAVVVWKVVDTAEACFEVDDYANFVTVQSEAALRNLATRYPYDAHDDVTHSLRGGPCHQVGGCKGFTDTPGNVRPL